MKTILITGSTDGIGKLAAKLLAKDGHQVLLHGRNQKKLEKVINEIKVETSNDNVNGFVADFSDLTSINRMVEDIKRYYSKIDVLINNAGVYATEPSKAQNGIDLHLVVNYLATVKLSNLLLPLLQESGAPRLINLSSAAQEPISLEALKGNEELSARQGYAQSKLAIAMWSLAMAEKYKNITTIAVNPGSLLNTKMVQEVYGKHWSSADKGAQILYDLALLEQYKNDSGQYFDNDKGGFGKLHEDAYNQTKINDLLTTTDEVLAKY